MVYITITSPIEGHWDLAAEFNLSAAPAVGQEVVWKAIDGEFMEARVESVQYVDGGGLWIQCKNQAVWDDTAREHEFCGLRIDTLAEYKEALFGKFTIERRRCHWSFEDGRWRHPIPWSGPLTNPTYWEKVI